MSTPWHPHVIVDLSDVDGNAFNLMGKVVSAMHRGGVSKPSQDEFMKEAMSGNYDHLLATIFQYVTVETS